MVVQFRWQVPIHCTCERRAWSTPYAEPPKADLMRCVAEFKSTGFTFMAACRERRMSSMSRKVLLLVAP